MVVCSQENEFIEKIVKIFYCLCFYAVCEQFALCLVVVIVLQKRVDIAAFIYIILNLSLISFKACLFYGNLLFIFGISIHAFYEWWWLIIVLYMLQNKIHFLYTSHVMSLWSAVVISITES